MTLIVRSGDAVAFTDWHRCFAEVMPELAVHNWPDPAVQAEDIRYAVVWEPDPGRLASFPNLRLIISAAAGVDHILRDPNLPRHLPLVRMVTPEQTQLMGEYVCWAVLSLMRRLPAIIALNASRGWNSNLTGEPIADTRVGVMGLGAMGSRAAEMLVGLGYATAGWSTTQKTIPGVESFAGASAFPAFLARTDILVCLLPLTPSTEGIINADTLALLPPGASVVNAGRGGHVVMADLIAGLDSGHIKSAMLDVFTPEPLPQDSPVWEHPGIFVTPHVASFGSRRARARHIASTIAAFERGEPLVGLYDPQRGY